MSSYGIHNSWLMRLQMDFPLANKFTIITILMLSYSSLYIHQFPTELREVTSNNAIYKIYYIKAYNFLIYI